MLTDFEDPARQPSVHVLPGMNRMSQLLLTALFAIALSFLTFAASFADVPRSEVLVLESQQ